MTTMIEGKKETGGKRFAIVVSRFNLPISKRLLEGALDAFSKAGASNEDCLVVWVPGAFEIPGLAEKLAASGKFAALVCLGAVIRGETPHFDYICTEVARGISEAARETGIPILFGVLTCETLEQAMERSGGEKGNKGWEAAQGAVEMADLFERLEKFS